MNRFFLAPKQFVYIFTLLISLFLAMPLAAQPPSLSLTSAQNIKPNGEYIVYVQKSGGWREIGELSFDKFYRERKMDLGEFVVDNEPTKIRLVQKGGGAAQIDAVFLGGIPPVELKGSAEALALKKLAKNDFDVLDAYGKTLDLHFPAKGLDRTLSLVARIEGLKITETPFQYPTRNLYQKMTPDSAFYTYKLNAAKVAAPADGRLKESKQPFFKEWSVTGTGHPSGFTYGWAANDDENLYVKIDFTSDNTMDGDSDYTKVYVKTGTGLKEFKITSTETRWGIVDFTYTDKAAYQHKVYDFKIPFQELGIGNGTKAKDIQLAFAAYGTSAPTTWESVAVNPVTNKIYIANRTSSVVNVVDGATGAATIVTAGSGPAAIAINTATNKIYIANYNDSTVTVIDGATNSTATVTVGSSPNAIAVNPVTNLIYVANYYSNDVTVIDGATNATSTVAVGSYPLAVAVNPVTIKIYVANYNSDNVTVIDGASNATSTVAAGTNPLAVAVNPVTNRIYVANISSNNVTVIDGASDTIAATVTAGSGPAAVAVNPVTNKVYVTNGSGSDVTMIDGAYNDDAHTAFISAGTGYPLAVAINSMTNRIYVATNNGNVAVIDGAFNDTAHTTTVSVGTDLRAVAVNPVTNKVYVANYDNNSVIVIDGATNATSTVAAGTQPYAVAVNPVTNKIYVANPGSNDVTVIDGATNATSTVAVGSGPFAVAVNPVTNKIYVANSSSNDVTVIDGATNATTSTVAVGTSPWAIAVNPVTNKIYVANFDSANVTVIDGATNATSTVAAGTNPRAVAVNPVTNKIYVANQNSNDVTVIDGATNATNTVSAGTNPYEVAVNPVTNKIYVANWSSNDVTVIDGAANATSTVAAGTFSYSLAVNPVTNKIYVTNPGSNDVTVIDGATNTTSTVAAGTAPYVVAVNPVTNKIYVTNYNSNNVTVIDEQAAQPIPLTVAISPLTNNVSVSPTPTFSLTATSTFAPPSTVRNVYFQYDTWQGEWKTATTFNGTTGTVNDATSLLYGNHVLYTFATDGQDSTSTNTGSQSSPLIGSIAAYAFTVAGPISTPPSAISSAATSITQTGATLNGTVNDNGAATTVTFEYGLSTSYGSSASGGTVAAGAGSTAVSANISGLACGNSYHFRVNGANSGGTTNGADQTFSTAACPDTTPPAVTGAIPTGPSVRLNSNATITWNENIDCSNVNTTNITTSAGGWTLSSCSGNQAVFATSGQSSSTPYTVTVSTAVKDLAGNAMAADYTWTFTTGSAQVYGHILDDNTVALWRLNEASASANAVDETGIYHLTQFGSPDSISGRIDNGRLLNGSSKFFQAPADAGLGEALNGDWTYEGWVYLDPSSSGWIDLLIYNGLAFSYNQPDTILAEVGISPDRKIFWHQWQSTGSYTEIASNATIQAGQFYHIAVSRTAQGGNLYTYRIYVNGVIDTTTTDVTGLSYAVSGASHYIGLGNFTSIEGFGIGGNVLNGRLDDTRISKVARSDAEILESSQRVVPAYTVNFVVSPLGTGTLSGTTSQTGIASGGSTTAVAPAPNAGYSFVNWTGTGGFATSTSNPLTVTNVTANMTITANFANTYYLPFNESFDLGALPAEWGLVMLSESGNWIFSTTGNVTGGNGGIATVGTYTWDAELRTPAINMSGATRPSLEFKTNYTGAVDNLYVDVSTDGLSWTNVWSWINAGSFAATTVTKDITAAVAGNASNVIIRFRFANGDGTAGDWSVDDVKVYDPGSAPLNPSAPTGVTAVPGKAQAIVSFTAPASDGGSAITGYTVTSSPGGLTSTGSASPITVTGLMNGTAYTFTVTATNFAGPGAASTASNSVTPFKDSQTISAISFSPTTFAVGGNTTVSATTTSGLPVTFSSLTSGVCTISGSSVTPLSAGTCTIAANQAGNANYTAAAQVTQDITVAKATPAITWGTPAAVTVGTSLSAAQLYASSGAVAGAFSYSPPLGTIMSTVGTQALSVTFTPADIANYTVLSASVSLTVNALPPNQIITGSDGRTTVPITMIIPGASLTLASGTLLTDAAGNPISGTLTMTASVMSSLVALPAGLTTAHTSDGRSLFALGNAIDMTISAGTALVKTINPPMTVNLTIPSTFASPGATVSYYSFNSTTWNLEGTAIIKPDGTADMPVGHLSVWAIASFTSAVDAVAPDVTGFAVPATSSTLSVTITAFTATDAVGVTGYLLSESATPPPSTDQGWTTAAPTAHTFTTWGNHTLYAYAKDAAGNISSAKQAPVFIGIKPEVDGVLVPAPVDTPTKVEPQLPDALKSLNFAMKVEIPTVTEILHGDVAPLVNGVPQPDGEINLGDTIVILRRVVGL